MIPKKLKIGIMEIDNRLLKGKLMGVYMRHLKYRGKAYTLTDQLYFPPHTAANKKIRLGPDGELLAIGGDWTPERIIFAYKNGIYPVSFKNQPILWWTAETHCMMHPKDIHIPKNMQAIIRQKKFHLTVDRAFSEVVNACQESRTEYSWLIPEQVEAFYRLQQRGFAHSVEVWQDQKLVGGLFGIAFGSYFHGSSMFSRLKNTSKLAYIALSLRLAELEFGVIDCGIWPTEHMKSLGAIVITREEYLQMLDPAVKAPDIIKDWGKLFENWDLPQAAQKQLADH